jgi:outer membrane protein OmpA-like peptidoglycan-associated protein
VALVALLAALAGCAGSDVRSKTGTTSTVIATARDNGAQRCAPVELAMAESHNDFANHALDLGNYHEARREADVAAINAKLAVDKSPREKCVPKKIVVEAPKPPPGPGDIDGDGILDNVDRCPRVPEDKDGFEDEDGCPDDDNDGDGLVDKIDKCPLDPEDKDAFEDDDGCPDDDNDKDGLADKVDKCPNDPEDKDGFEDGDGVPDPDNDKDTIADAVDQCMNEPEDMDGFQDGDGCPDPDNDKDTVADAVDECPLAPGKPENKGCPVAVRFDDKSGKLLILQKVEFATNADVILSRSFPLLQEVAATIAANPQLKRLRVEGHTDSDGPDAYNLDLSQRRVKSVIKWLVEKASIDPARLEGYGCGEIMPIASNATVTGKQENRRVEFFIVDPAPTPADPRDMSKCLPAH